MRSFLKPKTSSNNKNPKQTFGFFCEDQIKSGDNYKNA